VTNNKFKTNIEFLIVNFFDRSTNSFDNLLFYSVLPFKVDVHTSLHHKTGDPKPTLFGVTKFQKGSPGDETGEQNFIFCSMFEFLFFLHSFQSLNPADEGKGTEIFP